MRNRLVSCKRLDAVLVFAVLCLALPCSAQFGTVLPPVSFGHVSVGTAAAVRQVTYNFTGSVKLSAVNILTKGVPNLDFTDGGGSTCRAGTTYNSGNSCVVNVAFKPSAPGLRAGAVTLFGAGSNQALATAYVSGIGDGPTLTFDIYGFPNAFVLATPTYYFAASPAVDGAGNVYEPDGANCFGCGTTSSVIRVDASSHKLTTVVSGLDPSQAPPGAVALDGAGNLYVADTSNSNVLIVPNENGMLNGADMKIVLSGLTSDGLVVDGAGNLYLTDGYKDQGNNWVYAVQEWQPTLNELTTIDSNFTPDQRVPVLVALDAAGNLYVGEVNPINNVGYVWMYPGAIAPAVLAVGYDTGDADVGFSGLAVDASATIYEYSSEGSRIPPQDWATVTHPVPYFDLNLYTNVGLGISVDALGDLYFPMANRSEVLVELARSQTTTLNFCATNAYPCPVPVGTSTTPQTITLTNAGNQPLTFSSLTIPAHFQQQQIEVFANNSTTALPNCSSSTSLSPGGSCVIGVACAPTGPGPLHGTLTLTDNALNRAGTTQTIALSCNDPSGTSAAAPYFIPPAGTYTQPTTVSIFDTTGGATIYYTLDGSTPTTSSNVYSAPITVSANKTIKAIATAPYYSQSAETDGNYTINTARPIGCKGRVCRWR